jgi:hypothetical protein
LAVSDIVLRGDARTVHDNAGRMPGCSCVAGATEERRYLELIRAAGFADLRVVAERPAASGAELRAFVESLGLDPAQPQVEALAPTLVGTKPVHSAAGR